MKAEKQRLAIAKVCGWEGCSDSKCDYRKAQHLHKGGVVAFPESYSIPRYPDYPNDLNAMHEAEELFYAKARTLEGAECMRDYSKWLCHLAKYPLRATAAQRAEAFLRTIGKWEEATE